MSRRNASSAGASARAEVSPRRRHERRRTYLVDRPFQLAVAFTSVAAVSAGLLVALGALWVLPDAAALESLSGSTLRILLIGTSVGHFVIAAGAVAVASIVITHRVAGPAGLLKDALDGLAHGRCDLRTRVRRTDYLQDLALATGVLSDRLAARNATDDALSEELDAALEAGDLVAARTLLLRWHEARPERLGSLAPLPTHRRAQMDDAEVISR